MSADLQELIQGISRLGIDLPAGAAERLLAYRDLLVRWNRVYNLTAVRDPAAMIPRHLLDSLAVLPHLAGIRLLDVGTGAGLPGIPLALARPDLRVALLDSQAKRIRFLRQAVIDLGLANAEVVQARVEAYRPAAPFDCIVSRAFSRLEDFVELAGDACAEHGVLLAMKGALDEEELGALPAPWRIERIDRLIVPELEAERHLVRLVRG